MNDIHRDSPSTFTPASVARRSWRARLGERRVLVTVAALLAIVLLAWLLTPKPKPAPTGRFVSGGPMPIVAAPVRTGDMPITLIGLGTVTPLATVTVQSQIAGQIMHISFREGQIIKRGDPLILIDPRPYEVALEQAQGALMRDQALLANAKVDLARYQTLYAQDSIAEQQLATQKALVAQDEGNVKTDQGQIDAAKLNLTYCHISAPIDGRAGLQQVNVGNYVTPAEPNGLVVLAQLKPITVVFTLAEDEIPPLLAQLRAGKTLSVTAWDRTHTTRLATGTLASIDSQIDTTTGTLRLKAIFSNDDGSLFPQQFVNVDLLLETLQGATLIPQAAVQRGAPGTYVYVVNADQTVSVRKVTLGPGDATDASITAGLTAGEQVVVDGADKLKDGARILLRGNGGAGGGQGSAGAGPDAAAGGAASGQHSGGQHPHRQRTGAPGSPGSHAPPTPQG
jgi:membrane fusion protein, multidrug efflux system